MLLICLLVAFVALGWWAIHFNNGWWCTAAFGAFVGSCFIFVPDTGSFFLSSWGLLLSYTVVYFVAGGFYAWADLRAWLSDVARAAQNLIDKGEAKISPYSLRQQMDNDYGALIVETEYPFSEYPPNFRTKRAMDMIMMRCTWWPLHLIDKVLTEWVVRTWQRICRLIADSLQRKADRILPTLPEEPDGRTSQPEQGQALRERGGPGFPRDMALREAGDPE